MTAAQHQPSAGADTAANVTALAAAVAASPDAAEPRYRLGGALLALGEREAGERALADGRTLHTLSLLHEMGADLTRCATDGAYAAELAALLYARHHVAMSSELWAAAAKCGAATPASLLSWSLSLLHQGRPDQAVSILGAACEACPSEALEQFLVLPHVYLPDPDKGFAAQARRWAARHAPPCGHVHFDNPDAEGRRLRVGYVAPSFSDCQVRQFITPVIEAHDPARVEVFLYPADASAERGWPQGVNVRSLGGLDDAAAAALIRRDGVDVLGDCWGHTAGGRLGVFARRAAPVQFGWINFTQTTGLAQMDHLLHADDPDGLTDPALFSETIVPIGPVFTVFRPTIANLTPSHTPALATGVVTFASFNHPAKLNLGVLHAWAEILRGVPASRLLLKYRYFDDPVLQRVTRARFEAMGVDGGRIAFQGHSSGSDYSRSFNAVDLALDPWPAPGSTTTLEALSHGAPVLALAGPDVTTPGHYPRTILEAAGLPELVCGSISEYVAHAIALTRDVQALDRLRQRVRPGLDAGPLRDEASFTRRLEQTLLALFDRWRCSSSREPRTASAR